MYFIISKEKGCIETLDYNYIEVGFDIDTSINSHDKLIAKFGNEAWYYSEEYANEHSTTIISPELEDIKTKLPKLANNLLDFIITTIRYNHNYIILNIIELPKYIHCNYVTIKNAIEILESHNIIRQARKYAVKEGYNFKYKPTCKTNIRNSYKPFTYIVNHNYIFRGKYYTLYYDIFKQRKISNDFKDYLACTTCPFDYD